MKRRLITVLLIVVLLLALPVTSADEDENDIYFVAYNDTIPLTMTPEDKMHRINDVVLVPHMAFEVNGSGITPSYDAETKVMTLYSRNRYLAFDLNTGIVRDETGKTSATICAYRNQVVYLPLELCAGHFGLTVSILSSKAGYNVIRFTDGSQINNDAEFIKRAEIIITYRVQRYLDSISKPPVDPEPDPPAQPDEPAVPVDPKPPATVEQPKPKVYIAVTGVENMPQALDTLQGKRIPGVFFLTRQEILENAELVRSIRASGFSVGLTVEKGTADVAQELKSANEALDSAIQTKTLLVLLDPQQQSAAAGYCTINAAKAVEVTQAVNQNGQFLLICGGDCSMIVERLELAGAEFYPLRETSPF